MLPWGICPLPRCFRSQQSLRELLLQAVSFAGAWAAHTPMERNQFYGRRLYQPEPGGIAVAEGDLSTAQSNDSEQEEHFLRKIDRRCAVL